jgi:hypothetical protein
VFVIIYFFPVLLFLAVNIEMVSENVLLIPSLTVLQSRVSVSDVSDVPVSLVLLYVVCT